MSFGKVCIKHSEYVLSFETALVDSSVNVGVSHCFIIDIQVPHVPNQPKTFRIPQRTFGVKTRGA